MAKVTTDHDKIRNWVESRGGVPATVEETAGDQNVGVLRIDFPYGDRDDNLSTISWESFFEKFDQKKLAFLHDEETATGEQSRFCKFVARE
jgi:hypothetical protein